MNRFIANFLIAFDNGTMSWRLYVNHVGVLDDNGRVVSIEPFEQELPNTRFLGRVALLAPDTVTDDELLAVAGSQRDVQSIIERLNVSLSPKKPVPHYRILVLNR